MTDSDLGSALAPGRCSQAGQDLAVALEPLADKATPATSGLPTPPARTPERQEEGGPLEAIVSTQAAELALMRQQVERFHDRAQAQEDVIARMQARLEALQADQVRALLGPVAGELAALHGELSEVADREPALLAPERLTKELRILLAHVEAALDKLGMQTVAVAPGSPFDRRWHAAHRGVPTAAADLDQTVAEVLRHGFAPEGAMRAAVPALVTVYQYDAGLAQAISDPAGPVEVADDRGSAAQQHAPLSALE